jgi:drug/metabolite transporter (DMT)-like permease
VAVIDQSAKKSCPDTGRSSRRPAEKDKPFTMAELSKSRSPLQAYLAAAGTVVIWASFLVISRLGGKTALTGWDIAALRLGVGALLLLPFSVNLRWAVWSDLKLWVLALSGGAIFLVFVYSGLKLAPAAHGGILVPGMQPFLVTLLTFVVSGVRPPRQRIMALLPIALGVVCAAMPTLTGLQPDLSTLTGDALLFTASSIWALYSVLARKWAYDSWVLTRFLAIASALVYLPIYLVFLPKGISEVSTGMLVFQGLYQGIGPTILAMMFFLHAVKLLGAERTGALIALVPILAGLAAVPLLDEPLTLWLVAGLALVSSGAYLASRPIR